MATYPAGARITTDPDPRCCCSALHLLSADTQTNLVRLAGHDAAMGDPDSPVPVSIRIDDPWQAEMRRRSQPVFDPVRWQPEVISRYEATAGRIADDLATSADHRICMRHIAIRRLPCVSPPAASPPPRDAGYRGCVWSPSIGTGFAADVTAFTGPRGKGAATISSIDADPSIEKLDRTDHRARR